MVFADDSAADLHRDMRVFSEGDLRTDSCGDWESDFPADAYRDSDADLRRDLQEDFRCGLDGDLRAEKQQRKRIGHERSEYRDPKNHEELRRHDKRFLTRGQPVPGNLCLLVGRAEVRFLSDGDAGRRDGLRCGIQVRTPEARTEFKRGVTLLLTRVLNRVLNCDLSRLLRPVFRFGLNAVVS